MKYKEWLETWLEVYVKPRARLRTAESYARIIDKQINPRLGDKELVELTLTDIQKLVNELLSSGHSVTKNGLAERSVNTVVTVIQSSLRSAVSRGEISANVAEGVVRPKIKSGKALRFTPSEQKQIERAVLADPRNKMFGVVLCLYTGLCVGELLALTWSDIDLESGDITVSKICHDRAGGVKMRIADEPKTASKRTIPIPKQLLPHLARLCEKNDGEHVISVNGQPVTVRSYQRSFALLLKKTGIDHKSLHALRHTFAFRALECGMDIKMLSEILGHKNAMVTANRYALSLKKSKRDVMDKLGELLVEGV